MPYFRVTLSNKRKAGFTLVELMVAMVLFSVLSTMAYRTISMLSATGQSLSTEQDDLASINTALHMLTNDMHSPNDIVLNMGTEVGESVLRALPNGTRKKIEYSIQEEGLYRQMHEADLSKTEDAPLLLLGKVKEFRIDLLGSRPDSFSVTESGDTTFPPAGYQIAFLHQSFGRINRMIYTELGAVDPLLNTLEIGRDQGTQGPQTILQDPQDEDGNILPPTSHVDENGVDLGSF